MFAKQFVKNQRGLTLIEIMIVLVILGGLMAILGQRVIGGLEKAKVKQATVDMGQIMKALDFYYTDCGSYPPSLEALINSVPECTNWGPDPYLKKMPQDPWNNKYVYETNANGFLLKSLGKDKTEGGTGYNKDLSSEEL